MFYFKIRCRFNLQQPKRGKGGGGGGSHFQRSFSPHSKKLYWKVTLAEVVILMATLPETNSSPLKMDGWNTSLSYWVSAYFQGRAVSSREGNQAGLMISVYATPQKFIPIVHGNPETNLNIESPKHQTGPVYVLFFPLPALRNKKFPHTHHNHNSLSGISTTFTLLHPPKRTKNYTPWN